LPARERSAWTGVSGPQGSSGLTLRALPRMCAADV
jgi:hypothetical protein